MASPTSPQKDLTAKKKSKYKSTVPAVDQCMEILNCLSSSSRMTLSEICERTHLHKSKCFTILNSLAACDFVEKDPQTKVYKLGLGIVSLARNVLNDLNLQDILNPHLKKLAQTTDATAHYGMVTKEQLYIIAKEESSDTYGYTMRLGVQHHLTHGAHGKAIVSVMSPAAQEEILATKELCFYGDGKPFDMEYLRDELATCRELGYALDLGETNPNITSISSAVTASGGRIVGAVILIGVFQRSRVETFGPMVAEAARRISEKML